MTNSDLVQANTIIMIRDEKTRIVTAETEMNYSQNDTVIIIMNGKVEVVDKQGFREMVNVASMEDNPMAMILLNFVIMAH